jgi:hypothetical protein
MMGQANAAGVMKGGRLDDFAVLKLSRFCGVETFTLPADKRSPRNAQSSS